MARAQFYETDLGSLLSIAMMLGRFTNSQLSASISVAWLRGIRRKEPGTVRVTVRGTTLTVASIKDQLIPILILLKNKVRAIAWTVPHLDGLQLKSGKGRSLDRPSACQKVDDQYNYCDDEQQMDQSTANVRQQTK